MFSRWVTLQPRSSQCDCIFLFKNTKKTLIRFMFHPIKRKFNCGSISQKKTKQNTAWLKNFLLKLHSCNILTKGISLGVQTCWHWRNDLWKKLIKRKKTGELEIYRYIYIIFLFFFCEYIRHPSTRGFRKLIQYGARGGRGARRSSF